MKVFRVTYYQGPRIIGWMDFENPGKAEVFALEMRTQGYEVVIKLVVKDD